MKLLNSIFGDAKVSIIADPFKKNKIVKVFVHGMKFNNDWRFSGEVEFENGMTVGQQKFTGASFDEVVLQMKAMIESME